MPAPRSLHPGAVLGRYELVFEVATGGMGSIWAARLRGSRGFQKLVAIKTLLPALSNNPNFEQMFLDEARLASRLKHPNIVQVIDLGEEDDVLYQVMEWVNGVSLWWLLRAAARRGPVPVPVAARIVAQVCAGLHAAHELKGDDGEPLGLVHRDVSPQNVLVVPDGVTKVVDFGVAKYAGRGTAETKAGELRGKVPYMAPEHILGRPVDRRADVFALGVMLYQLVSGKHPFLQDDDRLTLARISSPVPAPPLERAVANLPAGLAAAVGRALAKKPTSRTATAAELARELARILPESAVQSANDTVAEFVKELAGEHLQRQSRELRDCLRRLEEPDAAPAVATPLPIGHAAPPIVPYVAPELVATGETELSDTLDVDGPDGILGVRSSWRGRRPVLLGAGAAVLAVAAFVALGGGGGSADDAPPPPTPATTSRPAVEVTTARVDAPPLPPPPSATPAASDAAAAASVAAAAAPSSKVPPRAQASVVPAVPTPQPPAPPPKKPKEFTPSGL